MTLRQKPGQDVPSFCDSFTKLVTRIEALNEPVSAAFKTHRFVDALLKPLQAAVTLSCPRDLDAAMEIAKNLERRGMSHSGVLMPLFKKKQEKSAMCADTGRRKVSDYNANFAGP